MSTCNLRIAYLMVLLPVAVVAQSITGTITGTVIDFSNLPVAGAAVTLTRAGTGLERQAPANERGDFVFSSLQPGEYHLKVVHSGFKTLERRSLMLTAAETLAAGSLMLEVGAATETVTVTAQGAAVQTATAERAGVITASQVERIMVRGRYVMNLVHLLPGVVDLQPDRERPEANWDFYALGNRRTSNNVSLDGMTINAAGNNFNSLVGVSMDAVAEVKVLLSNYQAEYGRMSGANMQIVTRSGTKEFHGLASYFKRHEQFNANTFFNNRLGQPKTRYRYNTWNYNLGGPVYVPGKFNRGKDKLFFFWVQEFWPLRTSLGVRQVTVPTGIERRGNFSQSRDLNDRLIVVSDPVTRQPFPGNVVPPSQIDPNGQALLNVFAAPNFFDRTLSAGRFNHVFQPQNDNPTRMETLKLDYNLNSNNLFFFNWTRRKDKQEGTVNIPTAGAMNWDQMRKTDDNRGNVYIARYQRIFTPSLINELNVGVGRRQRGDVIAGEELRRNQRAAWGYKLGQFDPSLNPLDLIPNATFGGVTGAANLVLNVSSPALGTYYSLTLTDSVTKTFPGHTVKAGFYTDRVWTGGGRSVINGAFDFSRNANNPLDTGYAYGNAILGVFNSYSEASASPEGGTRQTNLEWFVQDNWKVSRSLTLDLGMRFALIYPAREKHNNLSGFAPERFDPAKAVRLIRPARVGNARVGVHPVTGQTYPSVLIGAIAPGTGDPDNGTVVPARDSSYPAALMDNRGVHLQPRFGFAWDPFGRNKTAVRGGFGWFHNRTGTSYVLSPYASQPPLVRTPLIYFGRMPALLSSAGFLFPSGSMGLDRAGKVPSSMNFSFSIQQDIGFGTVMDVGYVGSLGRNLFWQRNLAAIPFGTNFNPANIDPTTGAPFPPAFLRAYPGYNNVDMREGAGSSSYHSLQIAANRRFTRGLEWGASWTWSKSMDFGSFETDAVSTLVSPRVWNYGLSGHDRTHVLKIHWLYDVPKSPWSQIAARLLFDGWQVSGVGSFVSGAPTAITFNTTVAMDITGSPTDGARVVVTGDPVLPKSERTFSRNFRTEVFGLPAIGTIGNAARSQLRGPGINNWDISVIKNFPVRESYKFQFRCEAYNPFNHTQFTNFDTTARFDPRGNQVNARFGEFTGARRSRVLQLALRFTF